MRQGIGCVLREAEARQPGRAAARPGGLAVRVPARRRRRRPPRLPRPASCWCVELARRATMPPAAAGRGPCVRPAARRWPCAAGTTPEASSLAASLAAATTSWPRRSTRSSWSAACRAWPASSALSEERRRATRLFAPYHARTAIRTTCAAVPEPRPRGAARRRPRRRAQSSQALPPARIAYLDDAAPAWTALLRATAASTSCS